MTSTPESRSRHEREGQEEGMEGGTRQRFVLVWGAPGVLLRFIFTITDAQVISGVIEKARRSVKRLSQQGERAGGVGWGVGGRRRKGGIRTSIWFPRHIYQGYLSAASARIVPESE